MRVKKAWEEIMIETIDEERETEAEIEIWKNRKIELKKEVETEKEINEIIKISIIKNIKMTEIKKNKYIIIFYYIKQID